MRLIVAGKVALAVKAEERSLQAANTTARHSEPVGKVSVWMGSE